jgi:hypothetical protein
MTQRVHLGSDKPPNVVKGRRSKVKASYGDCGQAFAELNRLLLAKE